MKIRKGTIYFSLASKRGILFRIDHCFRKYRESQISGRCIYIIYLTLLMLTTPQCFLGPSPNDNGDVDEDEPHFLRKVAQSRSGGRNQRLDENSRCCCSSDASVAASPLAPSQVLLWL